MKTHISKSIRDGILILTTIFVFQIVGFNENVYAFKYEDTKEVSVMDEVKDTISLLLDVKTNAKRLYLDGVYVGTVLTEDEGNKAIKEFLKKYTLRNFKNTQCKSKILNVINYKDTVENGAKIYSSKELTNMLLKRSESNSIFDDLEVMVETEISKEEIVKTPIETLYLDDEDLEVGNEVQISNGSEGELIEEVSITYLNKEKIFENVISENIIKKPEPNIVHVGVKDNKMICPAIGFLSSGFGMRWGKMHKGIDIGGDMDTDIKAALSGVVAHTGWDDGYGNFIILEHKDHLKTIYAHLNSINVYIGENISKGDIIGHMGNTGDSTGCHLHFEVVNFEEKVDPLTYIEM